MSPSSMYVYIYLSLRRHARKERSGALLRIYSATPAGLIYKTLYSEQILGGGHPVPSTVEYGRKRALIENLKYGIQYAETLGKAFPFAFTLLFSFLRVTYHGLLAASCVVLGVYRSFQQHLLLRAIIIQHVCNTAQHMILFIRGLIYI